MKFFCIADEDTVRGFRMAGVEGCAVETPEQAGEALRKIEARDDVGVVIMTDAVAAGIRAEVDRVRGDEILPLLVEIPGPGGPMAGRKSVRQFVQEAVGVKVGREEG
jgi:V/A-type H+-transporting ATPase subunit F